MAIIKYKNFSLDHIESFSPQLGDVFIACNLTQKYPHTQITDVAKLTFQDCNLINCTVAEDSVIVGCNTRQISRCGNLHDDYDCVENCSHVVATDEIELDGVVVETIYHYADMRVS